MLCYKMFSPKQVSACIADDDERMEEASRGDESEDGEAGLKFTPVAGLGFSMGFPSSSEARINASPSELAWIKSGLFPPAAKESKLSEQINGKRRSAEASLVSPPERLRPRCDTVTLQSRLCLLLRVIMCGKITYSTWCTVTIFAKKTIRDCLSCGELFKFEPPARSLCIC